MKEADAEFGIKEHKWYGSQDETGDQSIHDRGVGEPIVIRHWEFAREPGSPTPTKEQILTPDYLKHLNIELWADSLRLAMEPRVSIDDKYIRVFAPCVARTGQSFLEEPKLLQEWIK